MKESLEIPDKCQRSEVNKLEDEIPSEEFELTAISLGAHIETDRKLILRTQS